MAIRSLISQRLLTIFPYLEQSLVQHMATDEILLENTTEKVGFIRLSSFIEPCVSIGYAQRKKDEIKNISVPFTRRITGGGIVHHTHDLILSFTLPFTQVCINHLYEKIHANILRCIEPFFNTVSLVEKKTEPLRGTYDCFQNPIQYDVTEFKKGDVIKRVGGSFCRRKNGFLYQGSIQLEATHKKYFLQHGLFEHISSQIQTDFFDSAIQKDLTFDTLKKAHLLAEEKYNSSAWIHKRQYISHD